MSTSQLNMVRHGARGVLALGVMVSIVANVLHAADNLISQAISAWAPIALMLTIELIARVPVRRGMRTWARLVAMTAIAGIAAWVSYFHMVGVALRYGEESTAAHLIPLTVDGLVVVAWVSLVEIGGRIQELSDRTELSAAAAPMSTPSFDHARPIGPDPAPAQVVVVDKLSTAKPAERKRPPSSRDRVVAAHNRTPNASDATIAARLEVSEATVKRHRPGRLVDKVSPELAEVSS